MGDKNQDEVRIMIAKIIYIRVPLLVKVGLVVKF